MTAAEQRTTTAEEFQAVAVWALLGKTGMSSKSMAAHLLGQKSEGDYPRDGGDFARCEGLLDAVPSFRERLGDMASLNSYWAALVPRWEEIRASNKKYELISEITRPIEDQDQRIVRFGQATVRF